ncbi:putative 14-3-3 protein [Neospora caninum Liverpool]|uniref:Putative 14-3-3 protein n=1 Tax=Neospora caninum (strain Liverpool) TaxID=572307 RepID=F0VJK0_NEOCL|nr:putative 14-3-3 protein [Neospora caninum Liverpool]CBZ53911.1 putative 14-3-3 protein [Neospora caninum Liverpool]|eukprot:XP_003883943.1 putative 14-3-3 protein [Neospora caninum Liverpool]
MAREDSLYMARLAEETERYEDLVFFMKKVVEAGQELNDEERNLLSVGYKNIVGGFRTSWRSLALIEQRDLEAGSLRLDLLTNYRRRLELQLQATCDEVTQLVDKLFLRIDTVCAALLIFTFDLLRTSFFPPWRRLSCQDEKFRTVVETAHRAYEEAYALAEAELPECHPVRLGIALNYSVFYYEALIEPDKACDLARAAIDASSAVVHTLGEDQAKDTLAMMQLLQDNLELWTTETLEEGGPPEEAVEEQL